MNSLSSLNSKGIGASTPSADSCPPTGPLAFFAQLPPEERANSILERALFEIGIEQSQGERAPATTPLGLGIDRRSLVDPSSLGSLEAHLLSARKGIEPTTLPLPNNIYSETVLPGVLPAESPLRGFFASRTQSPHCGKTHGSCN